MNINLGKPKVVGIIGSGENVGAIDSIISKLKVMDIDIKVIHLPKDVTTESLSILNEKHNIDLIIKDDEDISDLSLIPDKLPEPLEIKNYRVDSFDFIEDNKPKQYPKRNWKRKLKKYKKR